MDKSFFLTALLSCPLLTESLARFSNIEPQNYKAEPVQVGTPPPTSIPCSIHPSISPFLCVCVCPSVQMNVWLPSGTEVDELFGSVDPGQAVLLEVWDQDPGLEGGALSRVTGTRSTSPTKRPLKRTPTYAHTGVDGWMDGCDCVVARFLGECWLPSLSSLVTLQSRKLELKAADGQSDNTKQCERGMEGAMCAKAWNLSLSLSVCVCVCVWRSVGLV